VLSKQFAGHHAISLHYANCALAGHRDATLSSVQAHEQQLFNRFSHVLVLAGWLAGWLAGIIRQLLVIR
jgi:hypothetical protein